MNPAEELANERDVAETRGMRIDPRVSQNVLALVQQAEGILIKEMVPLAGWIAVAAASIAVGTTSAAGFTGLFLVFGSMSSLPFVWIPYFVKRRFCNDVLRYLRKEPEGLKVN